MNIDKKQCTKCKKWLPITTEYFSKNKNCKNGINSLCKECDRKRGKQYYTEHREQRLQHIHQYYIENPEKRKQISKQHYIKNKEYHKQYNKQYYIKNKGEILEKNLQWHKNNPEKSKERTIRHINKRKRNLGFEPLNKHFEGSEAHHINKTYVIYIPKKIHRSIYHCLKTGRNMIKINKIAMNYVLENI